jgi:YggT family protein
MSIIIVSIAHILIGLMRLAEYILIAYIIIGWFVFFGVLKNRDGYFFRIYILLMTKIEPLLAAIRNILPPIGGLDFSAIIIFFGLYFAKLLVIRIANVLLNVIG